MLADADACTVPIASFIDILDRRALLRTGGVASALVMTEPFSASTAIVQFLQD
jgi:hypothetical protein